MKNFFKPLFQGTIILIVSIFLAEVVLRLVFDEFNPGQKLVFEYTELGNRIGPAGFSGKHSKNTGDFSVEVKINENGFRDIKPLSNSKQGDWFVVGDSFSFGFGVEEKNRYSNHIERQLNSPIFNISIPNNLNGYFSLIQIAKNAGANIDRIIVSVCMENDISYYRNSEVAPKIEANLSRYFRFAIIKRFLAPHSAVYAALSTLAHNTPWIKQVAQNWGLIVPNLEGIPNQPYHERIIESSIGQLENIKNIAGLKKMLIVVIPSRGLWVDSLKEDAERIHYAFIRALVEHNFDYIDLRPDFELGGNPLSYHFKNDGHWNNLGHSLAASVISQYLRNNLSNMKQ